MVKVQFVKAFIPKYPNIQGEDERIVYTNQTEKKRELQRVLNDFRQSFITRKGKDRFPSTVDFPDDVNLRTSRVKRVVRRRVLISTFRIKGKTVTRLRDAKTGRFVKRGR